MDKYELAAYLVNLHMLMDAQPKVVDTTSNTLAEEYARVWEELKQEIIDSRKDKRR